MLILHNTSSTAMTSQLFSHTWNNNFDSVPVFAYGSGYQESRQFVVEDFHSF